MMAAWETHRKFGYGGIVAECFAYNSVRPLVVVRDSIDPESYCKVVDNEMLPILWCSYVMDPCCFKDDKARCYVAAATMR